MPVENERKFVLPANFSQSRLSLWTAADIRQGYLDDGPRLRQIANAFIFTYKKWVPANQELIEIETHIDAEDFHALWPLCTQKIQKTRYKTFTKDGEWVVDFLKDEAGGTFFVLAEVEMPRHQPSPASIPDEISDSIIYAVEAGDARFTNKKLSNPDYATDLLNRLSLPLASPKY